jgi:GGDEF domain-containing protein
MADDRPPRGLFKRLAESLFEEVKPTSEPEPTEAAALAEGGAEPDAADLITAAMGLPPPTEAPSTALRSPASLAAAQAAFEVRLQRIAEDNPKSTAGKLQLLDLESLRAAVGERWQEVADRASSIAEQVIQHRLAPSDVFAPYEDTSFVMLFAELNEQQAKLKSAAIAREIRERLVGELGGEDRSWIKAFVCKIPEVSAGSAPTIALLDKALGKAPDVAPAPSSHHTDPALKKRVGEIGIIFRPTLFQPRKILSIYDCRAQRLDAADRLHVGAHAYARADAPMVFEIDREVLTMAVRQLRATGENATAPLVQVMLHAGSLLAISGGQLVDIAHGLPQPLRRHLVVEMAGIGGGAGLIPHLGDAVKLVQPFCRAVIARIWPGVTDLDRLARYGFVSIGIDLDDPDIHMTAAAFKMDVLPLARLAHAAKLQAYLYGLTSAELARAASGAGFDYLNGPAIAAEVAQPAPVQAFAKT